MSLLEERTSTHVLSTPIKAASEQRGVMLSLSYGDLWLTQVGITSLGAIPISSFVPWALESGIQYDHLLSEPPLTTQKMVPKTTAEKCLP